MTAPLDREAIRQRVGAWNPERDEWTSAPLSTEELHALLSALDAADAEIAALKERAKADGSQKSYLGERYAALRAENERLRKAIKHALAYESSHQFHDKGGPEVLRAALQPPAPSAPGETT